jgi:O-phospho-L-seryl-tRNASec:L-selenocysteinyl-tRNA synthase
MDAGNLELAKQLVDGAYITQGEQALQTCANRVKMLLSQRRIPDEGWDDGTIEYFLHQMALMDSNNFVGNVGVGEREARVYSSLVSRRHWNLGHGIGRSGDVAAVQPKAAGSSLINKLTNCLARDALKIAGLRAIKASVVMPIATGMTVALSLLTMSRERPAAR